MKLTKHQKQDLLKLIGFVLFGLLLLNLLLPSITSAEFRIFVEELGVFGPIGVIAFIAISQILAPIPGSPGIIVSLAMYGILKTTVYSYIAMLISGTANFYIGRLLGRRVILKIVGKRGMAEVDRFAEIEGAKALALARIFGFALFDYVSFAAGLTNMSYKKYISITALVVWIPGLVSLLLFRNVDFSTRLGFTIWYLYIIGSAGVFGYFVKRYYDIRQGKE